MSIRRTSSHPPPTTPLAALEDELAQMCATPADRVRQEIADTYPGAAPAVLRPFLDDPEAAVGRLADLIREYWRRALAPYWARLRGVLEGDVLHRARRMADGGAVALFEDVHPELRFANEALWIEKSFEATATLDGRGLLLVPSAFVWPVLMAITEPPWQPSLIYPARGAATLWDPGERPAPSALAALLGARRACILSALDTPRSTAELSRSLGVVAGSVSQHLGVLRAAGLVTAHRVGRVVLYVRSDTGEALTRGGQTAVPAGARSTNALS